MRNKIGRKRKWFFPFVAFFFVFCVMAPAMAQSDSHDALAAAKMETILSELDIQPQDYLEIKALFGVDVSAREADCAITTVPDWQPGMTRDFWVINPEKRMTVSVRAQIVEIGRHVVFWAQSDRIGLVTEEVGSVLRLFDEEYYEKEREIFGHERNPGIDCDERIHVLLTDETGDSVYGYFSSRDGRNPLISPRSNGMEMFVLNLSAVSEQPGQTLNTLTHEFQHMIHNAYDANEESFVDEGFAVYAEFITNTKISNYFEKSFFNYPDTSLTKWAFDRPAAPSYGASFLFMKYLIDRLGKEIIQPIIREPKNGLNAIEKAINEQFGADAPALDDLFAEWISANLFLKVDAERPPYAYQDYVAPQNAMDLPIRNISCEEQTIDGAVEQYGQVFFDMRCSQGKYRITIRPQPYTPVISLDAMGEDVWWSGRTCNADAWLQRELELPNIGEDAPLWLDYEINWEIEDDFDFLYVFVSEDDGASWHNIHTDGGSDGNASGFNHGWGYSGSSDGWLHERIDLRQWRGKKIDLRFDYITDEASLGQGALIRHVTLNGRELPEEGWRAHGFVKLHNRIPQPFLSVFYDAGWENGRETFAPMDSRRVVAGEPLVYECDFNQNLGACYWALSGLSRYAVPGAFFTIQVEIFPD